MTTRSTTLGRILRGIALLAGACVALLGLALLLLWLALRPPDALEPPEPGARFARVVLIEPGVGRTSPRSLRIEGTRIAAIAEPGAPDAYADAFVLPGFTDMHVHLPGFGIPGDAETHAFLLLAHGITTARVAGEMRAGVVDDLERRRESGAIAAPDLPSCGPFVDGDPPLWPGSQVVRNPEEARAAVDALADAGARCIKAYDGLDADSTVALREAAHARGLPLIGHTPLGVDFATARLDDVQHLRGMHPPLRAERERYPFFLGAWRRSDAAWRDHALRESLAHGIAQTPTLVTLDALIRARDPDRWLADPALALLAPFYREALWNPRSGLNAARFLTSVEFTMLEEAFAAMQAMVGHLHRGGVPIHTGSDTLAPGIVPGASLHRELALLADAGLGIEGALASTTRVSPRALGIPDAGSLFVGAHADLVVFERDPTQDLANLDTLLAVVKDGRLYERARLDAQRDALAAHHASWIHREALPQFASGALDALLARLAEQP